MSHQKTSPANPANAPSERFFPQIGLTANMRVRAAEVDLDALAVRLDDERRAVKGTIFWDLAFLVAGRCGGDG